jgi:hypothetical protein
VLVLLGDLPKRGLDGDSDDPLHLKVDAFEGGRVLVGGEVVAEDGDGAQTVGSGVVGAVLLEGVVGEVDVVVGERGGVEAVGGGGEAQVALLEDVELPQVVQQRPHPDVELVPLHQQRVLDVFLQNQGSASSDCLLH